MSAQNKTIGFIVESNDFISYFGPLCEEFHKQGFLINIYSNCELSRGIKNFLVPISDQKHLSSLIKDKIIWYESRADLAKKLERDNPVCVFAVEAQPFSNSPELFSDRKYKIFNLTHSVDNFHLQAITNGSIDKSIVPFENYPDLLDWKKEDCLPFGTPKYDHVHKLLSEDIRKKYHLPKKYILIFAPNNMSVPLPVFLKIIIRLWLNGYHAVIKGKFPRCHQNFYHYLSRYFLSQESFYPFIVHELIKASSGCIAFDSTVVEEVLMLEKPLVNFSTKPYREKREKEGNFKMFSPMWKSDFCLDLKLLNSENIIPHFADIPNFIKHFQRKDIDYKKIQAETFFIPGNASKNIVSFVKNI